MPPRSLTDRSALGVAVLAWRPHLTAAAAIATAALASRPRRRGAATALGAVALAALPALAERVWRRPAAQPSSSDFTVLALNVLHGRADTGELATLLERERPDLVALSEAGCDFRDKLMPLISGMGYRSWAATAPGVADGEGVVLLAADRMGLLEVRSDPAMPQRSLRATGGLLGERSFIVAHTISPVGVQRTRWWCADMATIGRWCREPVAPIVAGDLNATLDHALLRDAIGPGHSAAAGTGRGLAGTFPTKLPRALGIQIDHVIVPAATVTSRFEIVDVRSSDHRAVLTQFRLPAHPGA
ncbi:endonuclease/exonuclease/phosphatase family protein [Pseudonocardia sp. TRM90224]|uniref:endonuclease/exonuclease/phosphatase family protein n=1 Tax=Pseudonocardia sp. TRM90224 TaxID=2812678 RepID=UPI001E3FE1EC|nr:endonuclease/exonuclease/phosphatase family protein [Pseudonocardia sp. TRM90224]